jgi:molybdate transport system ATP-binding protein
MADREQALSVRIRQAVPVPLDLDFACAPGEVLAIFGPSGSGKTTVLRAIAGLAHPPDAEIRCSGVTWLDTSTGTCAPAHVRRVGFVFQDYALFPHLTAIGNVMTALGHRPSAERRRLAEALLARVRLGEHADRRPRELSGGERQRVALARALAREPSVLLLDEPFAAVDRVVRRRLQDEIDDLRRTLDVPLVLVTHDFEDVVRLATHVLVLDHGRSAGYGPIAALTSRPDLAFLRDAVGAGSVLDAVVSRRDPERGLTELTIGSRRLLVPGRIGRTGDTVRIRIPAREVILATKAPEGLSLHNVLSGQVTAVHFESSLEHMIVQVDIGGAFVLAEVTSDAVARLDIAPGSRLYALVKSVSIDVRGSAIGNEFSDVTNQPPRP